MPLWRLPPFRTFMATGVMRPPTNRKILRKTESTESVTDEKPAQEPAELSDDEFYVSVYIPDIKVMRAYKILLGECTTARELAVVVGKMLADENCRNVDKHTVVKAAFIKSLLPFAKRLVSGGTIANIRAQINNMLASK